MKHYFFILTAILFYGCAQQISPTGGDKDISSPKITESSPQNFSTEYSGNQIKLKFDEYVKLQNINQQILVTPALKNEIETKLVGKWFTLTINDTLQENTTYNFNFGTGIADITEGNSLDSNQFIFSTGSIIDSLKIVGELKDAETLEPIEGAVVMLYQTNEDSLPYKERPDYFGTTKANGAFEIGYLKQANYKLFALKDVNSNYLFDNKEEESIAFISQLVVPNDTHKIELKGFKEIPEKNQFLKEYNSNIYGQLLFYFNEPTENPQITLLDQSFKKDWYVRELFDNKDTLRYWVYGIDGIDTLKIQVRDGAEVLDTITAKIAQKPDYTKKKNKQPKVNFKTNIKNEKLNLYDSLKFKSNVPLKDYDLNKSLFIEGKDTSILSWISSDNIMMKYAINHKWKEDTKYQIFIPSNSITDIYGNTNDTLKFSFLTTTKNGYADVNFKVNITKGNYILQLINEKGHIVDESTISESTTLKYLHLVPAGYKLKLIYDVNNNGKWDTGNYIENSQPEKVIYYSGKIDVRAGWDMELEWNIE